MALLLVIQLYLLIPLCFQLSIVIFGMELLFGVL